MKQSVLDFARDHDIRAGVIVSCVGSLTQFNLRFANKSNGTKSVGFFEIVSFTGTFSNTEGHFHMSISDGEGRVMGGHVLSENLVYTTAEIAIAQIHDVQFSRELDLDTGYAELKVFPAK